MSYVDDIRRSIEDILDQIEENTLWIEVNGPKIIDAVTTTSLQIFLGISNAYNPFANRAKEEIANAVALSRTNVAILRFEIKYVGSPDNLRAAADSIDEKVILPARDLADQLVLGRIPSALDSNYSDGAASEGYRAAIDGRDAAVRDIETYAAPVAGALRDVATGIEEFYRSILDFALSILGLLVSIVVIIVGWETIFLGILGVIGVIGVIGVVISLAQLSSSYSSMTSGKDAIKSLALETFTSQVPGWPAVLS